MSDKIIKDCNPSICLCWTKIKPNELMSNDWTFITKEIFKTLCSNECKDKQTCWTIIDKLQQLKTKEAIDLLSNIYNE